ncbi:hypothetical protein CUMW_103760 [Citrus unshiu]|nr:hypothetical protein CUMW_103760 [Citrus unshiu]
MRNSNSWTYKDKEITELSRTHHQTDDSSDEADGGDYGFQALSSDSIQLRPKHKPTRVSLRSKGSVDGGEADLISEIDQKIKEHVGSVLHEVSGLSARVTQLESRMRRVENSVDDLKVAIEYNYGKTDGKLRELDNIMREVQGGIKDLKDKQEIAEVQLQLAKLQLSKGDPQLGKQSSTSQTDSSKEDAPSNPVASPPQPASLPSSIPHNLHHQNPLPLPAATAPQLPSQLAENITPSFVQGPQYESYSPSTFLNLETTHQQYHTHTNQQSQPPAAALYQNNQPKPIEATHQQYHLTSTQQSQPPPPTLHQPYQPSPQPPSVSQLDQQPHLHPPLSAAYFQAHHPSSQHPGLVSYLPSQSIRQSSSSLAPAGFSPAQQLNVDSTQPMHDQTPRRPYSEYRSGYSLMPEHSNSKNLYPYGESPFGSSGTNMKLLRSSTSPSEPSGGSSFSQLPTAKILPHAIPMASSVDSESASVGSANRVPVDDVVDKVATMGFRRDLVRATVRKLTENGQSVDLNVVLDKLMNNG